MTIPMTGPAGLFTRLGKLGLLLKQFKSYQTSQLTNMTDTTNGVVAQYNAESDIQALMGSNYIQLLNSAADTLGSFTQNMGEQTVNRMVFRDQPQLNQNLQQTNLLASLNEVIRQMSEQGDTVLAMTVTGTVAAMIAYGNGVMNVSVRRASDGAVQENAFAEDVFFQCESDSYSGSAAAGNEAFSVTGTGSQSSVYAFDWPLGSNATVNITAIDGASDNDAENYLTNSDFEDWTNNSPDNYTLAVGTPGTTISREASIVYSGDFACRLTGTGVAGVQVEFLQEFDNSDGTEGALEPQSQYSYCLFLRRDGTIPAAGTIQIDLVDENGVVINDDAGAANSLTVDATLLSTVYTAYTAVFRTPAIMPDTVLIRYRSNNLTNTRNVYLDRGGLGDMTLLYTGGPSVAVHSGSIPFLIGDYGYATITNSRGAAGTLSTFQTLLDQLFSLRSLDLLLPSSGTPTISDGLIA